MYQCINESMYQCNNVSMNQCINESYQWINESMYQWINESMYQWINVSVHTIHSSIINKFMKTYHVWINSLSTSEPELWWVFNCWNWNFNKILPEPAFLYSTQILNSGNINSTCPFLTLNVRNGHKLKD